jgi:hypothetical protein
MMISSRYHVLSGPVSTSRGQFIHDQIWRHVQELVQRLTLGEEANPRIRTVGSIEALLLLTEWYARTMHFRGSSTSSLDEQSCTVDSSDAPPVARFEYLVEPSRRLDRTSWMFLGAAQMLAHELGILQELPEELSGHGSPTLRLRSTRARELLFIYTTLLAARLGFRSMITLTFNPVFLSRTRGSSDRMLAGWIDLIKLTKTIHAALFSAKSTARDLVQNGDHVELLQHFDPLLRQWQHKYLDGSSSPLHAITAEPSSETLLLLEYLYVRMYSNSPALQALASRVLSAASGSALDPALTRQLADVVDQSEHRFVHQVIHDAQQIVEWAIAMAQAGSLRFYPARAFQRFVAACAFLLKASLLGNEIAQSGNGASAQELVVLLRQSVDALRASAVDDAHLPAYYALLLERQIDRHHSQQSPLSHASPPAAVGNPAMSESDQRQDGAAVWHTGLTEAFDDNDFFAEFTMLGELGCSGDIASFNV